MTRIVLVALALFLIGAAAGYLFGSITGYDPFDSALTGGVIPAALWCYIVVEKNS